MVDGSPAWSISAVNIFFQRPIVAWNSSPFLRQAAPHGFTGLPANVQEHTVATSGDEGPKPGDSPEMVAVLASTRC
jgi:hypothetical protein